MAARGLLVRVLNSIGSLGTIGALLTSERVPMADFKIAPSILSADFARLGKRLNTYWQPVRTLSTLMSWTTTTCPT